MGNFNIHARRVRNPTLDPIARRNELSTCVRHYADLTGASFHATRQLLDARFGVISPPIPTEESLIAAMDALEISRNKVLEIRRQFAALRLRQKMRGIRSPRRRDVEAMKVRCQEVLL